MLTALKAADTCPAYAQVTGLRVDLEATRAELETTKRELTKVCVPPLLLQFCSRLCRAVA